MSIWQTIEEKIFPGPDLIKEILTTGKFGKRLRIDRVMNSQGEEEPFIFLEVFQGVNLLIIDKNDKIVLVKEKPYTLQYMAGLDSEYEYLSLPGGRIEENETPKEAAVREAREEIGITCLREKDLVLLGKYPIAERINDTNGVCYCFSVTIPSIPQIFPQIREGITDVVIISFWEAWEMVGNGKIIGPGTVAAITRERFRREK